MIYLNQNMVIAFLIYHTQPRKQPIRSLVYCFTILCYQVTVLMWCDNVAAHISGWFAVHGQFWARLRLAKNLITLTLRIPIDVENPGAALSPFSRGNGISP